MGAGSAQRSEGGDRERGQETMLEMTPGRNTSQAMGQVTSSRGGQGRELASVNATGQRQKLGLQAGGSDPVGCQGEWALQGLPGRSVRRQLAESWLD